MVPSVVLNNIDIYLKTSKATSASFARWHAFRIAVKVNWSGRRPPFTISCTRLTAFPNYTNTHNVVYNSGIQTLAAILVDFCASRGHSLIVALALVRVSWSRS